MHKFKRLRLRVLPHQVRAAELLLSVGLAVLVTMSSASAAIQTRFQNRSLEIGNPNPGATSSYTITFSYYTQTSIGSLDMLFCVDPIYYEPCDPPAGLDVSNAQLADQTGETGYSAHVLSSNHILLTRTAQTVGTEMSSYTLTGIVNPTYMDHSFAIRLSDYSSSDGSGPAIDQASVVTQIQEGVQLVTQVPPMLVFCMGRMVSPGCDSVSGGYYTDMGILDPTDTLTAQSQFAVGTNASGGYVVTINSIGMAAGTHVINPLTTPTESQKGVNQFGINLVANTLPLVGSDPDGDEGTTANAVATGDYADPNHFTFNNGDVIASAPGASQFKRFTVSYIVNAADSLPAGVYSTTVTYICTGRF